MEKDYSLISFIHRAKRRRAVLESLKEPKTPKEIAESLKLSLSNVSNSLSELLSKQLIECINPNDHISRFYRRTNKGNKVLGMLIK